MDRDSRVRAFHAGTGGHGSRHGSRRGPCQEPLPHLSISWPRVVGLLVVPLMLLVRAGPRAAAHCSFPGDPFPSLSHFASLLGPVDLLIFLSFPALRLSLPLLLSFPLICCLNVGAAGSRNPSTFSPRQLHHSFCCSTTKTFLARNHQNLFYLCPGCDALYERTGGIRSLTRNIRAWISRYTTIFIYRRQTP